MKIALLASNSKLYSNKRIAEAAKARGHKIKFMNISDCYVKITQDGSHIYCDEREINNLDCIIPRIKPSITSYGTALVRQFEANGVFSLNTSDSILKSRDKLHALQLLSKEKIGIPITSFANSSQETSGLVDLVSGPPVVIKLLEGTKGIGVVLAQDKIAAENVINAFQSVKVDILVQQYISESSGTDIRCFVIGDQVIGSMSRKAKEGEFRANIHLGAKASVVEITKEEREIAIKATATVGLEIAGVDIVRSNSGPKVLEVNSSPGLEGIESATGIDIASKIIEHLEKRINLI